MARMSFVEADDEVAEFGQREPHRHLPTQHAARAWIVRIFTRAFARDNERDLGFIRLSLPHKAKQRGMSFALRHAVQIDPGIDSVTAARHALLKPAVEWREQQRFGGRLFLPRWRLPPRGGGALAGRNGLITRAKPAQSARSSSLRLRRPLIFYVAFWLSPSGRRPA